MRNLVLLRGAPGAGKSTFIKEHNLASYTICPDDLRLLYQTPVLTKDGSYKISQKNDGKVWKLLFHILEERMSRGEFTVIDATHSKTESFNRYKKLKDFYRYRMYCVDFSGVDIAEAKRRNLVREEYKHVSESVIDTMYARLATQPVPKFVTVIKPEEFERTFNVAPLNFDNWKRIHHIGDIHGCYSVLKEYFKDGLKDDELYIFVGDYVNRGVENAEVVQFLISLAHSKNVIILTGNHEVHLRNWAYGRKAFSKIFENRTRRELELKGIAKKGVRRLYNSMWQLVYYTYHDKHVLVTHGGLSTPYINFSYISTEQLVQGVGDYETDIDTIFQSNLYYSHKNSFYQIHGHRNVCDAPVRANDNCFNLEGRVEFGGNLRVVTLDEAGFKTFEIKNDIYYVKVKGFEDTKMYAAPGFLKMLREEAGIIEYAQGDGVSSFTFDRQTFRKKRWNDITVKARGLFINTNTAEIVTRSYDKFFNINQTVETGVANLRGGLEFPVAVYKKENGFLGLLGYNSESDSIYPSSKHRCEGRHAQLFKQILSGKINSFEKELYIKQYLQDNNATLVFECIDPVVDPHVIEYAEKDAVLLDIVRRTPEFAKSDYLEVVELGEKLGLTVKHLEAVFGSWREFYGWYEHCATNWELTNVEGYVLEDSANFMVKIKLPFYQFWKHIREIKTAVKRRGVYKYTGSLTTPLANEVYAWLRGLPEKDLEKDIITLRNMFYSK